MNNGHTSLDPSASMSGRSIPMPNALVAQTAELARREAVLYARAGRLRHPAMVGRGLDTRGFSTALPHGLRARGNA